MVKYDDVAIVIPAYNEQGKIGDVVRELRSAFQLVIVVDDGSSDSTGTVAASAGAVVVVNSPNLGYDGAIGRGFSVADSKNARCVVTVDADGQHAFADVLKVADGLVSGNQLVVGIRPSFARISERVFSIYSRWRFGITDPLCGLKGVELSFYRRLGHFDSYSSIGTELAFFCAGLGAKYSEFPIAIKPRYNSASSFGNFFWGNYKIFKSMFKSFFRVYA